MNNLNITKQLLFHNCSSLNWFHRQTNQATLISPALMSVIQPSPMIGCFQLYSPPPTVCQAYNSCERVHLSQHRGKWTWAMLYDKLNSLNRTECLSVIKKPIGESQTVLSYLACQWFSCSVHSCNPSLGLQSVIPLPSCYCSHLRKQCCFTVNGSQ